MFYFFFSFTPFHLSKIVTHLQKKIKDGPFSISQNEHQNDLWMFLGAVTVESCLVPILGCRCSVQGYSFRFAIGMTAFGLNTHFQISQSLLAYTSRTFLPQIAEQEGSQSRDSQRRFPWLSGPVSGRQAGKLQGQLRQFLSKIKGYTHGGATETEVQFLVTRYQLILQRLLHHLFINSNS